MYVLLCKPGYCATVRVKCMCYCATVRVKCMCYCANQATVLLCVVQMCYCAASSVVLLARKAEGRSQSASAGREIVTHGGEVKRKERNGREISNMCGSTDGHACTSNADGKGKGEE